MTKIRLMSWAVVTAAVCAGLVMTAMRFTAAMASTTMTKETQMIVDTLFESTKDVCVGRFVVTIPKRAKIAIEGDYGGVSVSRISDAASPESFEKAVTARINTLKSEKMEIDDVHATGRLLSSTEEHRGNTKSTLIGYFVSTIAYDTIWERHSLIGKQHFVFSLGGAADSQAADRAARISVASDAFQAVPAAQVQPGMFCIEGGGFNAADPKALEGVSLTVALPDAVGQFTLNTQVLDAPSPEPPLAERVGQESSVYGSSIPGFGIVSQGKKTYAGQAGYEVFSRMKADDGGTEFKRNWEAPGYPKSVEHPHIEIELSTVSDVAPPHGRLSEAETSAVWDRVMGSLKLR